ncbi:MAG: ATP-binding cassette domain-containing protein [bacterium]|nr:ATP-binding cassette domain-containing protein [bacterium]
MAEAVISMKEIEKSYGKHKVLRDVNLEINRGDIYGLIGKNGAGKTTLFKILLGLSEYEKGSIQLENQKNNTAFRKKIGFLIGSNFFSYMTARQNLEYYRVLKGIRDKKEVERVLKIVELDQVKSTYKNYSMGMKQRLGIANAILGNPDVLILDEPTNGLDPQGIADVRKLIQKLNGDYGMTVIVSSHILGELQNTAHRFGIINEGTLVRVITREELQKKEDAVRITVSDLERARKALEEAGVEILEEKQDANSLEEFYFKLLGGNEDE